MKSFVAWLERLSGLQMALLLALLAELLFAVHLGQPNKLMFDEVYYVPAGRDTFGMFARSNEEHPLLAKWLIGLSIALFGDNPIGWRALSSVAGVVTMLGIYAIALRLLGDLRTAATAALLALLNQMLFIQARIAMLEVFAGAFLFASIALLVWGHGRPGQKWLLGAGICLGLGIGCKWSALPFLLLLGLGVLIGWSERWFRAGAVFGAAAIVAYLATFLPAAFYGFAPIKLDQILPFQLRMFDLQTRPLAHHTYQSTPWQWPLLTRPIWYLYEPVAGVQRGVLLLGNPAIMWGGLIALAACLWDGLRERNRALLILSALYIFSFAIWIIIPKKIGFFYYYYFPSLFLPLLIAATFHHAYRVKERWLPATFLAVSFGLFAYFYPILSAAPLPNDQAFLNWMWLSTWP
ncbi:phospholipid carrier-dependent glycosyltransferase [Sphingomonas sp. ID1715]|uniref:glycosyltransferase family 39 protein n=1 Tax=Sphingomonas sp. ID1715 TaxID=1656898 RepID=UPI0014888678|nr:glycosyltransferase family 39 protein [Sphingomonas sp. ID1715]NNM77915.1 phospholipid carrier-dependent glycosyltransferase [Sphingomonas sp. ID1715]